MLRLDDSFHSGGPVRVLDLDLAVVFPLLLFPDIWNCVV